MRIRMAAIALALCCGCFTNPRYEAGLAVQAIFPDDEALSQSTQIDVLGRVVFDRAAIDLSYGQRTFDYSYTEGATTWAGEIEFRPLGLAVSYLSGAPEDKLRFGAGFGFIFLTGAEQRIGGVTGIDVSPVNKLVVDVRYAVAEKAMLSLGWHHEFNVQDITLEKTGYDGVNLDAPTLRLAGTYRF